MRGGGFRPLAEGRRALKNGSKRERVYPPPEFSEGGRGEAIVSWKRSQGTRAKAATTTKMTTTTGSSGSLRMGGKREGARARESEERSRERAKNDDNDDGGERTTSK